ncbi:thiamine pyrophosphokinase [Pseudooceanicola sediminis]|uniref:Thiamine pyrophosphokinase n=1 Tax=Pseudooceanicola sediminis TaxID=2211117 RepID=A0A399J1P3_9RHOB|nr:thiamine pyrophosphokinase [Pseudooceanicola sediminis]KAA2311471.1 thiamine pyrophosphokinase [Puniceibacterium sp. HSS470]RII36886.1 thiamine pyrophosphokinase [Pseudooceanicola sediminis]|tara:strand:+ start:311 stop:1015 length:705 start_codon:yes stop_codon:yes gene_type:complete
MTEIGLIDSVIESAGPVALIGGGDVPGAVAERVLGMAGAVVGADGGAEWLLRRGRMPDAVIGDMDSLTPRWSRRLPPERLHRVTEQDSTDFEKCLTRIEAPLVLGVGFLGAQVDHMLAAFSVLARFPDRPCLLAGSNDVVFHAPPRLRLTLGRGARFSLYPMRQVSGHSVGLEWPIDGVTFAPDARVGTSNRVRGPVELSFDGPGMLVILPVAALADVVAALLGSDARWPALAG